MAAPVADFNDNLAVSAVSAVSADSLLLLPPAAALAPAPASRIYTAVYSGIPVYEMMVNGVAVMRRRADSFLNATQILKVGGVDKGRRTKILEKEIHTGEHEKVQGGYGKYQGTWVPFHRGRMFCRQYGVEILLLPLLDFDPAAPHSEHTPTKEQALAAHRKQLYAANAHANNTPAIATPLSSTASTPTAALSALGRAAAAAAAAAAVAPTLAAVPPPLQQAQSTGLTLSFASDMATDVATDVDDNDVDAFDRPAKRSRLDSSVTAAAANAATATTLEPLDASRLANYDHSKEVLTQIFLTNEASGASQLLYLEAAGVGNTASGPATVDVDVTIDDLCHSALHWAAALARIQLVRDLIARGADPRRGNYVGESSLVRAVLVTNNFDQSSFPHLLDLLYPAITLTDNHGRTVLHHIAITAGVRGRAAASRYYLECLLEWIVRRGTTTTTTTTTTESGIGLGRFMSEVVNAQDEKGDTALNIAARIGNKSIVRQLLEVGADATIPNRAGLRPADFGVGQQQLQQHQQQQQQHLQNDSITGRVKSEELAIRSFASIRGTDQLVSPAVVQKSKDIINAMTTMISSLETDFQEELQAKQVLLDTTHGQLRQVTVDLAQSRSRADQLKKQANKINELHQRDRNLENAIREEQARYASTAAGRTTTTTYGNITMTGLYSIVSPKDNQDNDGSDANDVDADGPFALDIINPGPPSVNGHDSSSTPATIILTTPPSTATTSSTDTTTNTDANLQPQPQPQPQPQTQPQVRIIGATIPAVPVLRARIAAYKRNAQQLHKITKVLKSRSSELEDKFRNVVSLCTSVPKDQVDSLLEGLVQAVQSDPGDVDMTRVAGFLKNVDDVAG
ncbi:hypothetical protein V1514DRAFT_102684 [Lipomyces japonicus]|uniref:uncharacterized protein n=1 Tax=Lipomyces japonicus TaxID=56871 RepID=UPI0034CEA383